MEAIRTLCHPHPWEEDAAVFASALGQLAEDAAMADLEDACKLSKAAREAGALQLCCDAVRHESARVHQPALAVLVCFTTTEVDPDAHLNRAIVSAHPRGFEGVVERLFSDVPLTVALACGALQNLCRTDVTHVAVLSAYGGTERLRSLTMCGQDGIAVAANACLTNLLGWHRAASRVQLRYLRHQRRVMGMQLRRMSSLKTSLAEGRAAPTLIPLEEIPLEEILLEEHSLATASPIASAHHGAGPPSMQVLTTAAKATPSPPSVCITLVLFNLVMSSADQADDAGGRSRAWSHSFTDPRASPALPAPAPPPPPPPPVLLAEQSTIAAAAAEAQTARADAAMQKLVVARAAAAAAAAAEAEAATAASSEPPAKKGPSLFKRAGRAVLTANALQLEQNQRRVEQIQRGVEERRRASELAAVTFRQAVASEQAAAAEAARLEAEEQTNARKAALEAALAEV